MEGGEGYPDFSAKDVQATPEQESALNKFIERVGEKWSSFPPEQRVYYTQLGLMAAVQAVDTFSTYAGLKAGTAMPYETNQVARFLLDSGGFATLGAAKMAFAAGGISTIEFMQRKFGGGEVSSATNNTLRVVNAIFTGISINNVAVMLGLI
jgi:hypothetical protein